MFSQNEVRGFPKGTGCCKHKVNKNNVQHLDKQAEPIWFPSVELDENYFFRLRRKKI